MNKITVEMARSLLTYDPNSGRLIWRHRPLEMFKNQHDANCWNTRYAGKDAGTPHVRGYIIVAMVGKRILAHRLVWFLVHSEWPDQIDHLNGDRTDNRLANLRSVSGSENQKNLKRPKHNTSGVIGVCWDSTKSKWLAQIKSGRRNHFIGLFDDLASAKRARKLGEKRFGFHPNHGRSAHV